MEWLPLYSDWDDLFDPFAYEWVIENGRWHDSNEFVDLKAVDAPNGEWMRIRRDQITLCDIINLYDSDLSLKSDAYDYDENGNWIFKGGEKITEIK